MSGAWYIVLAAEIAGAMALYLRLTWRERRGDFWPMAAMLGLGLIALLVEMAVQRDWLRLAARSRRCSSCCRCC